MIGIGANIQRRNANQDLQIERDTIQERPKAFQQIALFLLGFERIVDGIDGNDRPDIRHVRPCCARKGASWSTLPCTAWMPT